MNVHDILARSGLAFQAHEKWETATGSSRAWNPNPGGTTGAIIHHTASNKLGGAMPSKNVVVNGRTGVRGPLAQFLIGRDAIVLLVSQNRCNHAGLGVEQVLRNCQGDVQPPDFGQGAYNATSKGSYGGGNGDFWGIEVKNNGIGEAYPEAQLEALVRLLAALCQWQGWNPLTRIVHHREWTNRKIDMSYDGPIRKVVADFIETKRFEIPPQASDADTETSSTRPVLQSGSAGGAVRELQKALTSTGIEVGIDGNFGPRTEAAVKAFQTSRGLPTNGVVDPSTWAALLDQQRRPIISLPSHEPHPYPGTPVQWKDRGNNVMLIQEIVGAVADGMFGRNTETKVKQWQRARDLEPDGVVGPNTWAAMFT